MEEVEKIAEQRLRRVQDAINLKEPDRVPLGLGFDYGFIAKWSGLTTYDVLFNYDKAREAIVKVARDFPVDNPPMAMLGTGSLVGFALRDYPDIAMFVGPLTGPMHDILRDKYTRWPGRELSPNTGSFQFIGGEFMRADEYDKFVENPSEFMAEVVVPRAHQSLERPGSAEAMAALIRACLEGMKYSNFLFSIAQDFARLGYPQRVGGGFLTSVPLDFLGDFLRTIPGILVDLRKQPEKVKLACDVLMDLMDESLLKRLPTPLPEGFSIGIPLHLNEYLSPKLYYEFYWPHLKKIIVDFYNRGARSFVAFEGRHDAYLESILELPRGWGVAYFEKTDVRKAKKVLAGHTCVSGGIPTTLLLSATPSEIEKYVKNLLEEMMPGGGFMLMTSTPIPAETPPENIRAVIRAVEKYGVYRR
ncbi:MAG: uroporphyrinogen decarboxylase family protein [Candidatus Bathyarchaeia archaeon]